MVKLFTSSTSPCHAHILQILERSAGKVKVKSINQDTGSWNSTEEKVLHSGEGTSLALQWTTTNIPAFTRN